MRTSTKTEKLFVIRALTSFSTLQSAYHDTTEQFARHFLTEVVFLLWSALMFTNQIELGGWCVTSEHKTIRFFLRSFDWCNHLTRLKLVGDSQFLAVEVNLSNVALMDYFFISGFKQNLEFLVLYKFHIFWINLSFALRTCFNLFDKSATRFRYTSNVIWCVFSLYSLSSCPAPVLNMLRKAKIRKYAVVKSNIFIGNYPEYYLDLHLWYV